MTDKKFEITDIDSVDSAFMTVMVKGEATDWIWEFAGPAHPQAVAQSNRVAREAVQRSRTKEQAVTNNKKWKAPELTPEEVMADNVNYVLERLIGWTGATVNGEDYPFSIENARAILSDRRKGALLAQAVEFLLADDSFTKRSAKN